MYWKLLGETKEIIERFHEVYLLREKSMTIDFREKNINQESASNK